jgi:hypothetical protein
MTMMEIPESILDTLADMDAFNVEGRYPDMLALVPTLDAAQALMGRSKEALAWLARQF